MERRFRYRLGRAATFGMLAALVAVAVQWFIGMPVGDQPEWLGYLTLTTAVPSAYLTFPISDPLEALIGMQLGSGRLLEVMTPFGPAMRVGTEDLGLIALGTMVVVGLTAYLAIGVNEMVEG